VADRDQIIGLLVIFLVIILAICTFSWSVCSLF